MSSQLLLWHFLSVVGTSVLFFFIPFAKAQLLLVHFSLILSCYSAYRYLTDSQETRLIRFFKDIILTLRAILNGQRQTTTTFTFWHIYLLNWYNLQIIAFLVYLLLLHMLKSRWHRNNSLFYDRCFQEYAIAAVVLSAKLLDNTQLFAFPPPTGDRFTTLTYSKGTTVACMGFRIFFDRHGIQGHAGSGKISARCKFMI